MAKDLEYRKMIQSRRWRRLRVAALRQHPYCEDCRQKGLTVGATEVHHVTPVETGATKAEKESLMYNPANLRSLCHTCHVEIHRRMRVHTKETVKQRQSQRLQGILETFFPGVVFERRTGG